MLKEIKENDNSSLMNELSEAYGDVKAHISGNKELRTAEDLYNEL